MSDILVTPIKAFNDNYIWWLETEGSDLVVVVDPGDAAPVRNVLQQRGKQLAAILVTHHHRDHIGGIDELRREWPDATVYGPAGGIDIPQLTDRLEDGDTVVSPWPSIRFTVIAVPGHTAGHIAFYREGMLFCGDTVFAGGCGRVFDGSHDDLADSLQKIAAMPSNTLLYCAHEYTVDNLGFARLVEPDNLALATRIEEVNNLRIANRPSVPSLLATELETNPFMRCDQPGVIHAVQAKTGQLLSSYREVFYAVRYWKDSEYD